MSERDVINAMVERLQIAQIIWQMRVIARYEQRWPKADEVEVSLDGRGVSVQVHFSDDSINGGLPAYTSVNFSVLADIYKEIVEIGIAAEGVLHSESGAAFAPLPALSASAEGLTGER